MKKMLCWLLVLSVAGMCIYGTGTEKIISMWEQASILSAYAAIPSLEKKEVSSSSALAAIGVTASKTVVELSDTKPEQTVSSEKSVSSEAVQNAKGKNYIHCFVIIKNS